MNISFNSEHEPTPVEIPQHFQAELPLHLSSQNPISTLHLSPPGQYSPWNHFEFNENPSMAFAKTSGDQAKDAIHQFITYPDFSVELSNAETRSNSYLSQNQIGSSTASSSSNSLTSKNNNNNAMPSSITSIQELKSHFENLNTAEHFQFQPSQPADLQIHQNQHQSQSLPFSFDHPNSSTAPHSLDMYNHQPQHFSQAIPGQLSEPLTVPPPPYPNGLDLPVNSRAYSRSFPCPERLYNLPKNMDKSGSENLQQGNKFDGTKPAIGDCYHIGEEPFHLGRAPAPFQHNVEYQSSRSVLKPPPPYVAKNNSNNFYEPEKIFFDSTSAIQPEQAYHPSRDFQYPQQSHGNSIPTPLLQSHFQRIDQHQHHIQDTYQVYPQQYLRQDNFENELFLDLDAQQQHHPHDHHHSCPYSYPPQLPPPMAHPYYRNSYPQAYHAPPQYYSHHQMDQTRIEGSVNFNQQSPQKNAIPSRLIFDKINANKNISNFASDYIIPNKKIQNVIKKTKNPATPSQRKQSLQTFLEPNKKQPKVIIIASNQPLSNNNNSSPAISAAPSPDSPLSALKPITIKPRAISLPVTPVKEILKFISPKLKSTSIDDEEALRVKLESVELEKIASTELEHKENEENDNSEDDDDDEDDDEENEEDSNNLTTNTANNSQLMMLTQNKKNVVKNIMSAFRAFVLSRGSKNQIEKIFNGISDRPEEIDDIQRKFKRYIGSKNFNHYSLRLLILHASYGPIFKYFLQSCSQEWLENSKIKDTESHEKMITFFLSCFDDIKIIDTLRRHPKKKCRFS